MQALEDEGVADNTIVVFTSDHGEMLGVHGRWMKDVWYEPSIGVPLLIRYPKAIEATRRIESLIGLVDLYPTLFGLAGLKTPAGKHGKDRSGLLRGDEADGPGESQFLAFNTGAPPPELTPYTFPDESGRFWRGLRAPTCVYVILDQRASNYQWFYDSEKLADALPEGVSRFAFDLIADPFQQRPILPGEGSDALLDWLHEQLEAQLAAVGDDFIEQYWKVSRST